MDIEILRTFQAVSKHKSVKKASEELYVSGSTVTARVKILEEALKTKLFSRTGRRMELTDQGRHFLHHVELFMRIFEEGRQKIQTPANLLAGDLNLAAHPIVTSYVLPKLLKGLRDTYPMINIKLFSGSNFQVLEHLSRGKAELGIVQGDMDEEGFRVEKWFEDVIVPVFPVDHALAKRNKLQPHDFSHCPILGFETRMKYWEGIRKWFHGEQQEPFVKMEINLVETIKHFLAPYRAGAFLPSITVAEELQQRLLKTVQLSPPLDVKWTASFSYRAQLKLSQPARIFLEYAFEHVKGRLP